ncbi:AMINO ACID-LIGASE [Salix purpurea]|uniref:AMINO ACID-LIGASE n=1 Tax=Salix purpurea TaxID=77065 RepID=A0A9Q0SRS4_SALPP|nr:AMINO ACID-LIGASE [Salix purpurea]
MSSSGSSNKPRTVRLRCPSVSSTVSFFAWDDQRLDLGSIARTFGLDPSTLKLNGYFISRGADLMETSPKLGLSEHMIPKALQVGVTTELKLRELVLVLAGQQHQDINFLMNKRMKESNSGCDESYQMPKWSGPGLKRKQSIEHHVSLLKRLRINGANSGTCPDFRGDILSVSSCTLDL